ncbi:glycosyl hydrolase family 8 [Clostridium sp.]|uniref:glycosyl hydrolase family 8 n=1 Tax=Clostridium sp. TaxID=1506 RepID=UPI003F404AE8
MNRKIKKVIMVSLIGLSVFQISCNENITIQTLEAVESEEYLKEEEILLGFIENNMMDSKKGIYTNLIDEKSDGDITRGHSILSESQGMMMMYYLYSREDSLFDEMYNYINDNMLLDNGLISWRIDENIPSKVSATIDDLRIIKALLLGYKEFGNIKYKELALKISNGIYDNLLKDNYLIDFKDEYGISNNSTLCYLDLQSIKVLSEIDSRWISKFDKTLEVINDGYISKELPLYKNTYYTTKNEYSFDDIETLLSMSVILNKAEIGEDIGESINWIKERLKKDGYIASVYDINSLKGGKIESTSIYAIIVQIAKVIGDKELEALGMKKMISFQVKNKKSNIYGGFGNEKTMEVYSYDNLNALLAFKKVKLEEN